MVLCSRKLGYKNNYKGVSKVPIFTKGLIIILMFLRRIKICDNWKL